MGETTGTIIKIINGEMPIGMGGSFNLCDVRDLAAGCIAAADKGRKGECYILGNEEVTLKKMCELLDKDLHCGTCKFYLPLGLAKLLAKQMERNGIRPEQLAITDKAMAKIISGYTREAGVRNLERKLGEICRKAARPLYEGEKEKIKVTEQNLEKFLGKEKYSFDKKNDTDEVGIVRGLAWTSVGGDTLEIEVNIMPGKGEFQLTGQLGDVMKESAQAGISYIRSVSEEYHIPKSFPGE